MVKLRSGGLRAVAAFAAILTLAVSAPATACAALSAQLQDLQLAAVPYSHRAQAASARVVLTAGDTSDPLVEQGTGWHVTEQASDLHYSGLHAGTAIPARNLALVSVEPPVAADALSAAADPATRPTVPTTASPTGSLDTPRVVLHAEPGTGRGTYTQGLVLSLTLPPGTRAGIYTGTITTTISPGLQSPTNTAPEPMMIAASEPAASPDPKPTTDLTAEPVATTVSEPTPEPGPEPTTDSTTVPLASTDPTTSTDPVP